MKENTSFAYQKFKQICETKNITPYWVAKQSAGKVSTAALSNWKNGKYELKVAKLSAIAKILDVPIETFIQE